jgi:uncharacterized protein with GYD domain
MAKYLIKATYTVAGTKGLLKEGGSARRDAVDKAVRALGGTLETFYFCFGEADVVAIIEFPDVTSAVAHSLSANAMGAVQLSTTPLLSPKEIDQACKKPLKYRPPRG